MLKKKSISNSKIMDDKSTRKLDKKLISALKVLLNKDYQYIGMAGKGSFGVVLKLLSPDKKIMAAKFVPTEYVRKREAELWNNFDHPNVLPLLDVIKTPNTRIFLAPFYSNTLQDFLLSDSFCAQPEIFNILQTWLTDVLRGLRYLHDLGACHLDIKPDNVLATPEPKAVICDFGLVTSTDAPATCYGLPLFLRPPEACMSIGRGPEVDGRAFDVWSYGQLVFRLVTRKRLFSWTDLEIINVHRWDGPLWDVNYWPILVYPRMYHDLQPEHFENIVKEAFPVVRDWGSKIFQALNLVRSTLRFQPLERPTFNCLKDHVFFKEDGGEWFEDDPVWEKRMRSDTFVVHTQKSPSKCSAIPPEETVLHVPPRNVFPSYDISQAHSDPIINRAQGFWRSQSPCMQSDSIAARKEHRLDSKVYWDAHEGIFAVQPRKKKKGGIRGWMRKKFRGFLNCCSCLGGEQ